MLLSYILVVWQIQAIQGNSFNIYDSNNGLDGHCLSYSLRFLLFPSSHRQLVRTKQTMLYCFRPAEVNNSVNVFNFQHVVNANITFAQLRHKNITSELLLSWSASVDTAEKYQIYLDNYSLLSPENEIVFHNCTPPWFGPFCRFAIDHRLIGSFEGFVHLIFRDKARGRRDPQVTCYVHLTCETLLSCLNWREICDGKQDCLNGADEQDCRQLEMNECADDEYRCSNGQCIPWEYYRDDTNKAECLDQTDELPYPNDECYQNPRFECEEHSCRPGVEDFPCGDGECVSEDFGCQNGRRSFLPSNFCTNTTLCALGLYDLVDDEWCRLYCSESNCLKDSCAMIHEFRYLPLLFGHIRYVVSNETAHSSHASQPDYICYDTRLCPHLPAPTLYFNNFTCHQLNKLVLRYADLSDTRGAISRLKSIFQGCLTIDNGGYLCSSSSMYQCINSSKCISKHRLLDGVRNCPLADDENYNQSCLLSDIRQRFKCIDEGNDKCFTFLATQNGRKECKYGEDEYTTDNAFVKTHISFQTICDGIIHLLPLLIDGQNETDETKCESWQCNNTYSRCDDIWLCKNGADEVDCSPTSCPTHHHSCVFPNDTSKVSCLPIDLAGNDVEDCIGGTDERTKNRRDSTGMNFETSNYMFRCRNDTRLIPVTYLCDGARDCPLNDDEAFCTQFPIPSEEMCSLSEKSQADVQKFLYRLGCDIHRYRFVYFKLYNVLTYPSQLLMDEIRTIPSDAAKSRFLTKDFNEKLSTGLGWTCHRGVPIGSQMSDNTSKVLCLCPPSYYGHRCQYQNQRVSLTLQMRLTSDWRTIFVFLITLTDSEANIESHEYIEYTPNRDCPIKYDLYLLYATRPKNLSKIFSVRIDAFIGMTLNYRASWIFPLRFPFLPVHRLAVLLRLPFLTTVLGSQKCSPSCIHGQCSLYVNDQHLTFCLCKSGWAGARCDTKIKCECASDSRCISDSICLCPPDRFGARCHLSHSVCHSQSCLNGGTCVPIDTVFTSIIGVFPACMCPEGYVGDRCEDRQQLTQIDISFHHKLTIPPALLVHFIAVRDHKGFKPNRSSTAKKLQFDQSSLTVYTATLFNIALAQMFDHYYLIVVREKTITTAHISTQVIPDHRCRSLAELFDHSYTNQHLLKRVKFYHLPCQQHRELMCFYDEVHMCLCTLDRSANCWELDHNMTYECQEAKYCGDEGQCFQDDVTCPTSSFCACHRCSFGSRCQFSTKGSTLSLDIILGYHIHFKSTISQQPMIVKTSIALTSFILVFGMINGFLSLQTFRNKETQSVGCGLYLLTASILSMITVLILALKFAFLLTIKVGSIDNRWFVHSQCASMDYLLRSLLSMNDWLSACVSIERAVTVIQGVKFSKAKSKRLGKWMIVVVVVLTSCSYIHDPVHRGVMNDEQDQHIWCLTYYSTSMQAFDWIVNIFHFCFPFVINIISAAVVIINITRTHSNSQKTRSYKEHLVEQLHRHKHLLISPLILVALAVPRLMISFLSGCMGSARDSWLYLVGHYIAFIPAIMTVVVYILPSQLYKEKLYELMKRS